VSDAAIRAGLATILKIDALPAPAQRVEGGCINQCFRYETASGAIFVKVAKEDSLAVFEAEAASLQALRDAGAIRVPQVLGVGAVQEHALLALEWIDLKRATPSSDARLGEQLAAQHRIAKPLYGFKRNNFIGSTAQANLWSRDWVNFWRERRLEAQLDMAMSGCAGEAFVERVTLLLALMDGFFTSYVPAASLLHGDLWSGNYAADVSGAPVVFDPAAYYGDRECDLAMTRLFGKFGNEFYSAYQAAWPLDDGWQQRTELYNLYHILNHHNLFGGPYLAQADAMVGRLLAELGH
jgi:protein-ribulosamine 3-kinase